MKQKRLGFQYETQSGDTGQTAYAGYPLLLQLMQVMKLGQAANTFIALRPTQGYSDAELIEAMILLQIAGGDSLSDLDILETDPGLRHIQAQFLDLAQQPDGSTSPRFRTGRRRLFPSPDAAERYLDDFAPPHNDVKRLLNNRPDKGAFLPDSTRQLDALTDLLAYTAAFAHQNTPNPTTQATLDIDACIAATGKAEALYCYKKFKAYQPTQVYLHELGLLIYIEFRDGNCPAAWRQLEVLKAGLDAVPDGIKSVQVRIDTAGYNHHLLRFCAEGRSERFGVIEFAIGVDITKAFKTAVAQVHEDDWHPLKTADDEGELWATNQEWAEVCFVPKWIISKTAPAYRYLAIREPLACEFVEKEPHEVKFASMEWDSKGRYKVFGVITNKTYTQDAGDEVLRWHRKRCGDSEYVHSELKRELASGRFPKGHFWGNAAWWVVCGLALNVCRIFSRLVLGGGWSKRRIKALKSAVLAVAGRMVRHARRLVIKIADDTILGSLVAKASERLLALAHSGQPP